MEPEDVGWVFKEGVIEVEDGGSEEEGDEEEEMKKFQRMKERMEAEDGFEERGEQQSEGEEGEQIERGEGEIDDEKMEQSEINDITGSKGIGDPVTLEFLSEVGKRKGQVVRYCRWDDEKVDRKSVV